MTIETITCEKCERSPGNVGCSCGSKFCETCFRRHLTRNTTHRRGGTRKTEMAWAWISGLGANLSDAALRTTFEQDEVAKWFGLHVEKVNNDRVVRLVETPRFFRLVAHSANYYKDSPRRQFPSIVSFVGETGAGKSTLIRSLIHQENRTDSNDSFGAPVPGAHSGPFACLPTTGEVNLYPDPSTFGTRYPRFWADCEGMFGGEPAAALHQKAWSKHGRKYLLESNNGKQIDRKTAVMTIYPRFLYLFSDVICMVTSNQKKWADFVVRLLEWSQVGAHNTVNQRALPALIIVLNGPSIENESWISEDYDAATRDFFTAIEKEINENEVLIKMAKKHGDKSMKSLLLRNFSSIHVHYIPFAQFGSLGTSNIIMTQIDRLARRIQEDTTRVQNQRDETWTLYDAKQLGVVFEYAFKHLASGVEEPFDLNQCRHQVSLPISTEGHFAEFLSLCMHDSIDMNFDAAAVLIGSCIVRNSLKSGSSDILNPSVVFSQELRETCSRALDQFLRHSQPCAYVDEVTGKKCTNTKSGHALGHQAANGTSLGDGGFVKGPFGNHKFLKSIDDSVRTLLKAIYEEADPNAEARRQYAAIKHRSYLESVPDKSCWAKCLTNRWMILYNKKNKYTSEASLALRASVCYACLFGRPEYKFPCGHVLCLSCIREFDQSSPLENYPGVAIHRQCVLCSCAGRSEDGWPYAVRYRPDLSGIRILSLDGGGVRGIVQLCILQRIERRVGLQIPFGELFDLIIGTSGGGMIALGLGVHNFSIREFIEKFKSFCSRGFEANPLTKSSIFGWLARLWVNAIYKTEPLESAMQEIFGVRPLFGHHDNVSRVAVTTTVNSDERLIANYHWGDEKEYLNSNINTWHAARCTSAAPMYFMPALHDGYECRDGGLRENNPIQIGVNEAKNAWGCDAPFDAIVSIGCGRADRPQNPPCSFYILQEWLKGPFQALIATMNGQHTWENFSKRNDQSMLNRCYRLNIDFEEDTEPELDDTNKINKMERSANGFKFPPRFHDGNMSPVFGESSTDPLEALAYSLKASLYFFELTSIARQDDVFIIKGWICCRLQSDREAYGQLINDTSYFQVKNTKQEVKNSLGGGNFKMEVSFQQQESRDSEPVRIDVKFRHNINLFAISGFPMTLKALKAYWDTKDRVEIKT